jgi:hypothetical protein
MAGTLFFICFEPREGATEIPPDLLPPLAGLYKQKKRTIRVSSAPIAYAMGYYLAPASRAATLDAASPFSISLDRPRALRQDIRL